MTASEKLRRLEDESAWEGGQGGAYAATQTLAAALPALVAVVEALELVEWRHLHARTVRPSHQRAVAALVALDEALGEP